MFPKLFEFGSFTIYTYGTLIFIGFLLTLMVAVRLAKREELDPDAVMMTGILCFIVGYLGTKVLYVVTHLHQFTDFQSLLHIWQGGLVFYGGPITAIPFGIWYTKRHNIPVWKMVDIGAVCIPLAHSVGRLGCFSAGCCYGRPAEVPWAVRFTSG